MTASVDEVRGRTCLALDLDGVVYVGRHAVPRAQGAVAALREAGFSVRFATNSSASTTEQVATKLRTLGIECDADDVVTSAQAAAGQTLLLTGTGSRVLSIGSAALTSELADVGLVVTDEPSRADVVVVGLDPLFSYDRLAVALAALRRGVPLVGCNRDAHFPISGGTSLPGCGPLLAAVEAAAGRRADVIAGKPSPHMLHELARRTDTQLDAWFVVGDGVDSDVAMAARAGVPGVLVGPAVDGLEDLASFVDRLLETLGRSSDRAPTGSLPESP